LKKTVGR